MFFKRSCSRKEVFAGIDLWNRMNPKYKIEDRLVEQNFYAPFAEVNIVAWGGYEENRLIAFGVAKYLTGPVGSYKDVSLGWISLFTIEKGVDREIVFKELFQKMENDLCKKGVRKIYFGRDPQNFFPGLPIGMSAEYLDLFINFGFKEMYKDYDLYSNISDFRPPEKVGKLKQSSSLDLSARKVYKEEESFLLDFLQTNFSGRWLYEAENIKRIPGGVEDYWLLWYRDKPVGFARVNTSDSAYRGPNVNWGCQWGDSYCGLGPIGIAQEYRRRGWGLYLMCEIIDCLKKEGYQHMMIDWTRLLDYYKKLGFQPWREYISLFKELN